MGGALVQISVFGSQDIFLTGTPEITYFKLVYRRHTNFSTETLPLELEGAYDFGKTLSTKVERIGDLIYRTYLTIDIPEIALQKNPSQYTLNQETANNLYQQSNENFQQVNTYLQTNHEYIQNLNTLIYTNNVSMNDIIAVMSSSFIDPLINARNTLINYLTIAIPLTPDLSNQLNDILSYINRIDISILFNSIITKSTKYSIGIPNPTPEQISTYQRQQIIKLLNDGQLYRQIQEFFNIFMNDRTKKYDTYQQFLNGTYTENYNFAWVEELGHVLIEYIQIKIGGHVIDRHTGEWLIVWNQYTVPKYQRENYYTMIGDIPVLTTFNDKEKPSIKLIIPFQFWFCRYNGVSLPMICLKYDDVVFDLKLRDLKYCCQIENSELLINVENVQSYYNIHLLDLQIFTDYIYLDNDERRRFAQSSHEYLIEQVQINEFNNLTTSQFTENLTFVNPCKQIFWTIQPNQYLENPLGFNKPMFNNFGTKDDKTGQTIDQAWIQFHSMYRLNKRDPNYLNYVQCWQNYTHSVRDGMYCYNYSILPEEHQPSGTANLGRIDSYLSCKLSSTMMDLVNSNLNPNIITGYKVSVFTVNYNVLRFFSGRGGLAFQLSA